MSSKQRSRRWVAAAALAASMSACERDGPGPPATAASASVAATTPARAGAPATERLRVVSAPAAPLLEKPKADKPALQIAHRGDVVQIVRREDGLATRVDWTGEIDGARVTRSGDVLQVRRAAGDGFLFALASDLGPEADVPTVAWTCEAMARARTPAGAGPFEGCADRLRRTVLRGGRVVAYIPYTTGPCPVSLLQGGLVSMRSVEGLSDARVVEIEGKEIVLAEARKVEDEGRLTSGRLVTIGLSGDEPVVQAEVVVDEVDARGHEVVISRMARAVVDPPHVHVKGDRREVRRSDGTELSTQPIEETYRLAPDGSVAR